MPLLVNPGGRIVAIDDEAQYDDYKSRSGFRIPSKEEEQEYTNSRFLQLQKMRDVSVESEESNVYLATVSQGGKDGYGIASSRILNELRKIGCNISLTKKKQKVGVLFHNPYSIMRMEQQIRILYTMFESDKLPADWRDYLEVPDKILVPSQWCQKIFKDFGFDTEVVPLGYDSSIYTYHKRENKAASRKDFVFLHYNAFNLRKGFVEVLKAFNKAFKKDEPVKIIFKTTLKHLPFPFVKSEYPNIIVKQGEYEDADMVNLMKESDCFVFPSRGEGFGMTPMECMATGMPAIIPNAHGITEYFNKDCMYEVNVKETCPAVTTRYKNQDIGKMVICDVDHLAQQMRYVYEHQDEAMEKGFLASEYVKKWTFENTAIKLKSIIDRLMLQTPEDRPIRNILRLEEA